MLGSSTAARWREHRSILRALVVALVPLTCALASASAPTPGDGRSLFEGGARPLAIGAAPPGMANDASACAPCHVAIAAEWRGSLHAAAWSDGVFQASYAREPLAFCRNCHAPMNDGGRVPSGVAAHEGISCAACHVRDGAILGSGRHAAGAPHPVRVVAALGDSAYCASCHEFGFHTRGVETAELQQSTMTEWRRRVADGGDGATRATCQQCHMPAVTPLPSGDAHASHAFAARRDPTFLAAALDVDVRLERDGASARVVATLRSRAGHAVPTGDLFRRLELRVWLAGAEADALTLTYARSFGDQPLALAGSGMRPPGLATRRFEVADTRVGEDAATTRTLELAPLGWTASAAVQWRLDYLLMPPEIARQNGVPATVNVTRLRDGVLTP